MDKNKDNTNKINRKTVDAGYEARIKTAIEQYFGRKKHPKRPAAPSNHEQGQHGKTGQLF